MSRLSYAYINLQAIANNLDTLCNLADTDTLALARTRPKIIAVIKADAYGNGAVAVAQTIESKVDMFAVALLQEALELRQAGISVPILVLQGPHHQDELIDTFTQNIVWMLHSDWQVTALQAFCEQQQQKTPFWFKFDTGMHRLGFAIEDFDTLMQKHAAYIDKNTVICTHLSCADESKREHAEKQIQVFLNKVGNSGFKLCLANSATHIQFAHARQDYVRLGIALYGASPFSAGSDCSANSSAKKDSTSDKSLALQAVMHLETQVIALRKIAKGDTVGYGATWRASRESLIATLAIGYADGYPRHAPTGTPAFCNGRVIPLVGRVSMDMITFDVTDLPDVSIGDMVQLWGDKIPINQVAEHIGTIAYELMARVSPRIPRKYNKPQ